MKRFHSFVHLSLLGLQVLGKFDRRLLSDCVPQRWLLFRGGWWSSCFVVDGSLAWKWWSFFNIYGTNWLPKASCIEQSLLVLSLGWSFLAWAVNHLVILPSAVDWFLFNICGSRLKTVSVVWKFERKQDNFFPSSKIKYKIWLFINACGLRKPLFERIGNQAWRAWPSLPVLR